MAREFIKLDRAVDSVVLVLLSLACAGAATGHHRGLLLAQDAAATLHLVVLVQVGARAEAVDVILPHKIVA